MLERDRRDFQTSSTGGPTRREFNQVYSIAKGRADRQNQMLICNAGIGVAPHGLTKDGLGNHFQVNNLSHHYLVNSLWPLITKTAESSVRPNNSLGDVY